MERKREILVIGHKNPDTDSICSAIAYAHLKNQMGTEHVYIPACCGEISKETAYVLDKLGLNPPVLKTDVRSQVSDIEIKKVGGVARELSIKKAYHLMKEHKAVTLAVTNAQGHIEGLISLGDIAESDMDVYDSRIVSKAGTPYKNIVETLDGKVLCGDTDRVFTKGKITIAANTPELMEEFIAENDLVIMGNRFETQFAALEIGVSCIVLCTNNTVSSAILKMAEEKQCVIISSPYDSYTVARLINQSMPIGYFMSRENLLTFNLDDFTNDVKEVMAKTRHRYFPVLDDNGRYVGQISKRSFLDMDKKKVILVDHNEKNQAVDGVEFADILEIIDHHRLGSLETINPVFFRNQPLGCTATIIFQMYREQNIPVPRKIAGALCAAILSDTLLFRSPTCTETDRLAAEELGELAGIDKQSFAEAMFSAGSDFGDKKEEEIFYQDYKPFYTSAFSFGVGQVTAMNQGDLNQLKDRMSQYMDGIIGKTGVDMLLFMLTNILDESSLILFKGEGGREIIETAYGPEIQGDSVYVKGLVSRKKQLVPDLIKAVQQ